MSASEILKELPNLTASEQQLLLKKLHELAAPREAAPQGEEVAERLMEQSPTYKIIDLTTRGIQATQARELRTRLKTFAEDWNRPETSIYDEDPAR